MPCSGRWPSELRDRVGRWCVEAQLQLTPEARPRMIHALAEQPAGRRPLAGDRDARARLRGRRPQRLRSGDAAVIPAIGRTAAAASPSRSKAITTLTPACSGPARPSGAPMAAASPSTRKRARKGRTAKSPYSPHPTRAGRPYRRMLLRYTRARSGADCAGDDGCSRGAGSGTCAAAADIPSASRHRAEPAVPVHRASLAGRADYASPRRSPVPRPAGWRR